VVWDAVTLGVSRTGVGRKSRWKIGRLLAASAGVACASAAVVGIPSGWPATSALPSGNSSAPEAAARFPSGKWISGPLD
jgi:hypothetical protein